MISNIAEQVVVLTSLLTYLSTSSHQTFLALPNRISVHFPEQKLVPSTKLRHHQMAGK